MTGEHDSEWHGDTISITRPGETSTLAEALSQGNEVTSEPWLKRSGPSARSSTLRDFVDSDNARRIAGHVQPNTPKAKVWAWNLTLLTGPVITLIGAALISADAGWIKFRLSHGDLVMYSTGQVLSAEMILESGLQSTESFPG